MGSGEWGWGVGCGEWEVGMGSGLWGVSSGGGKWEVESGSDDLSQERMKGKRVNLPYCPSNI